MLDNNRNRTFLRFLLKNISRFAFATLSILIICTVLITANFGWVLFTEYQSRKVREKIETLAERKEIDEVLRGWRQERIEGNTVDQWNPGFLVHEKYPGYFKVIYTSSVGISIRVYYTKDDKVIAVFDSN
jgi:hypothetical protein